ncbi:acetyl-CoA hydrolase/transferase family protein [Streptomyces phaeochromogenes]|uniref:acetyl-CoA hydrolase/transferase family protein n=1 Tax=Streptomyces phaeochromogenes TaxID=1923 RepID=UPI0036B02DD2
MDVLRIGAVFDDVPVGARVVASPCCGTPETLLRELGAHAGRTGAAHLAAGLLLGRFPFEPAVRSGHLRFTTWHVAGPGRALSDDGLLDYLPLRAGDVIPTLAGAVDVALIRVTPPDRNGWCSLGPSTTYSRAAVEAARTVVAEIDPTLPRTSSASQVHLSEIHRFVESDEQTCRYRSQGAPDPRAAAVADHVAALLPDGATVQLGIGATSEALATPLTELGANSGLRLLGLVTEAMIPLVETIARCGNGPVRALELLGGPELMAFADGHPGIEMASSAQLHDPAHLARTPRFVSVNSAAAVDLSGQVIADSVGSRVISGIGGSADFFEGAHLSPGGLRVVAMPSTTSRGTSTIVAEHALGSRVSVPWHSVDVVVTEHGAAWLKGRTMAERREALLAVADPAQRDALAGRPFPPTPIGAHA